MSATGDLATQLARAHGLMGQGKLKEAERLCRSVIKQLPRHGGAVHLLGLIKKTGGDLEGAEKYMRRSIKLVPEQGDFAANLGNLLRQLERMPAAVDLYRQALRQIPGHPQASLGLIRTLNDLGQHGRAEAVARQLAHGRPYDPNAWWALAITVSDQGRLAEAEKLYHLALHVNPEFAPAHHNLGSVLCQLDRPETALEHLEKAQALGITGYELAFNFGRTYLQLYEFELAEQHFALACAHNPADTDAQVNLARGRFVMGQPDFDRGVINALKHSPKDPSLSLLHGVILRRAGRLESARDLLHALVQEQPTAQIQSALAEVLHELGDLETAEFLVLRALAQTTDDTIVVENAVAILLARGRPEAAMPHIQKQRMLQPLEQGWIAYEATAARAVDRVLYEQLYDFKRLVRVYDLDSPPDDLIQTLSSRHRLRNHPLDQSLKHGSQTARNLVTDPDPVVRTVLASFQEPLNDYVAHLGQDSGHPMSARNQGHAAIAAAWSVQLRRQGVHVNHFHPEGWISSAYYVEVPPEVREGSNKAGWLKFGEPRFPVPDATPELFVQPKPGRLVLFPAYMWHGTEPLARDAVRTTIAFDASPKA